jgi:DNA-damage-inducible protein J
MKNAMIRARMDEQVKEKAEKVLVALGLSATDAITLFYKQIILHRGIPFPVQIPNATTRRTFRKTEKGEELERFEKSEDLFKALDL